MEDNGYWVITYTVGKLRYEADRTDRALAQKDPRLLHLLIGLVGRPNTPKLDALVDSFWPSEEPRWND